MNASRPEGTTGQPWQLQVFDVSLKKRQKLAMLLELLGPLEGQQCLLVTNGDNPGSLNYHLRRAGGEWRWCELEEKGIPAMERFLDLSPEAQRAMGAAGRAKMEREYDQALVVDAYRAALDIIGRIYVSAGNRAQATGPVDNMSTCSQKS